LLPRPRTSLLLAAALAVALLLTGCAADGWTGPRSTPSPVGRLGAGFEPRTEPSPEATIRPAPGSWDAVHPSAGYRVVLLSAGSDAPARTLAAAVRRWAAAEKVDLRSIHAKGDLVDGIVAAMRLKPDLIISTGNRLVDPLATVTASHLDQQFLVVGAEVAEPTHNVTAVDWTGASFRGEGLGMPTAYDPASFTPERCEAAVRAGVTAVLHDLTGIVLWID
jgi:hypothetical protein